MTESTHETEELEIEGQDEELSEIEKAYARVTLESILGGAAPEGFGIELKEVLRDIADLNKPSEAIRELHLVFRFQPDADRSSADAYLHTFTKLPKKEGVKERIHIGTDKKTGQPVAFEAKYKQANLFADKNGPKVRPVR